MTGYPVREAEYPALALRPGTGDLVSLKRLFAY